MNPLSTSSKVVPSLATCSSPLVSSFILLVPILISAPVGNSKLLLASSDNFLVPPLPNLISAFSGTSKLPDPSNLIDFAASPPKRISVPVGKSKLLFPSNLSSLAEPVVPKRIELEAGSSRIPSVSNDISPKPNFSFCAPRSTAPSSCSVINLFLDEILISPDTASSCVWLAVPVALTVTVPRVAPASAVNDANVASILLPLTSSISRGVPTFIVLKRKRRPSSSVEFSDANLDVIVRVAPVSIL